MNPSIENVVVKPLRKIPDERGTILHGVRSDTILNPFGEVYFKKVYFGRSIKRRARSQDPVPN